MGQVQSPEIDWKKRYDDLHQKYTTVLERSDQLQSHSKISDEAVNKFVETILADPTLNIYALPDAIEGTLYRNTIKIILHALAHASDETALIVLGHRIRIVIEPLKLEKEI
jgi:predicted Zn-dependent protease